MGAALSIVILFSISSTIVRVAAVFLEHTGISRDVARIQAMSALSGTGFTTSESELLLQTPERRRILVMLMITGSIGLASVVATVVVGAFGVNETPSGVLLQIAAILAAFIFVRYVLFSPHVDDLICGIAHRWLVKRMAHAPYSVLYQLDADRVIAEHTLAASPPADIEDWPSEMVVLGVRRNASGAMAPWDGMPMSAGSSVTLAGTRASQQEFAAIYGIATNTAGH